MCGIKVMAGLLTVMFPVNLYKISTEGPIKIVVVVM